MTYSTFQSKIKVIRRSGQKREVKMPYHAYKLLMDAYISQQIFNNHETKESLQKAANEIKNGKFVQYDEIEKLITSLDRGNK